MAKRLVRESNFILKKRGEDMNNMITEMKGQFIRLWQTSNNKYYYNEDFQMSHGRYKCKFYLKPPQESLITIVSIGETPEIAIKRAYDVIMKGGKI